MTHTNKELKKRHQLTMEDLQKEKVSAFFIVHLPGEGILTGASHLNKFEVMPSDNVLMDAIATLKMAVLIDDMPEDSDMKKIGIKLLNKEKIDISDIKAVLKGMAEHIAD